MSSEVDFTDFSFKELINFVSTISRTKKQSSLGVWENGHGLESIEHLESNVDSILIELTNRVQKSLSLDNIQKNFARSEITLPNEILNIFNITPAELNKKLYKFPPGIGADSTNGFDEIWFVVNNQKFIMKKDFQISVENLPRKNFFSHS